MADRYVRYQALKVDRAAERILRISFNRPDHMNALTTDAHRELADIWRDVGEDDSVSAVILRGVGKNFSAGGEFDMVQQMMDDNAVRNRVWREARDLVYNI